MTWRRPQARRRQGGKGIVMKLTTGILLTTMVMAGAAWGQDPNVIQSAKDKVNGAEQQKVAKENEALDGSQPQHQASPKPGTKPSRSEERRVGKERRDRGEAQ